MFLLSKIEPLQSNWSRILLMSSRLTSGYVRFFSFFTVGTFLILKDFGVFTIVPNEFIVSSTAITVLPILISFGEFFSVEIGPTLLVLKLILIWQDCSSYDVEQWFGILIYIDLTAASSAWAYDSEYRCWLFGRSIFGSLMLFSFFWSWIRRWTSFNFFFWAILETF